MALRATSIGVVFDRASGAVLRVINPDFERELDWHFVADSEVMRRVRKSQFGLVGDMTLDDLDRVVKAMS